MINLLPPAQKDAIKFGRINSLLVKYIFVAVVAVLALLLILAYGAKNLSAIQNDIKGEVAQNRSDVDELKTYHDQAQQISKQVETLAKLFEQEVKFSELLTSIGQVMPDGSALTQLSLNDDRSLPLNLTATVTNEGTAAVLRKNLEESDIFDKADIISITALEDDSSAYKFQVTISVVFAGADNNSPKEGESI
jgi:Tfp pilus assembly protein PilN